MGEAAGATPIAFGDHKLPEDAVINLDHGDPRMYAAYWRTVGECGVLVLSCWETMSYFSDPSMLCWFLEPRLREEVVRLHKLVGNANTDGKHIVVGTGSSQLFQAALYALASEGASAAPMDVVSAIPYYSSYPLITDFLQSSLYRWAGDAATYKGDGHCIEVVCSPNNPDGLPMEAMVKAEDTRLIHDLAYYWPQYTAILHAADHDIMLFTFSKCTGHAGTRIGWALVKSEEIARKMTKYIELNTIGVSKDSQLRAAKIMSVINNGLEHPGSTCHEEFFQYGSRVMTERWRQLREAIERTGAFSLPEFPSQHCRFSKQLTESRPAFAWVRCEKESVKDCCSLLKSKKILTRSGRHFGMGAEYVRISMLDRDPAFDAFIRRISAIQKDS